LVELLSEREALKVVMFPPDMMLFDTSTFAVSGPMSEPRLSASLRASS